MNLGPIMKAVVGAVGNGVVALIGALLLGSQGGAHVTGWEWLQVALAVLVTGRAVWQADNIRWFPYAKSATQAAIAFLTVVSTALLAGHVDVADILRGVLAILATTGLVLNTPNASVSEWHDSIGGDGQPEPADPLEPNPWATPDGAADDDDDLEPVDVDGDGHDDRTGQFYRAERRRIAERRYVEGFGRLPIPGGALALILGGAVLR